MTQPPGWQPPQEGFGAPYEPSPTAYGQPPQGGYGYPPQGGHGYPPQQHGSVPAPGGPGGPGGSKGFGGRPALLIGAVLAVLLIAGGGVWLATGDGDGNDSKPVAGDSRSADPGQPSGSPSAVGTGAGTGPTAEELNKGRKPGEGKVLWLRNNDVDLPRSGAYVHGPWLFGDMIAKGMWRTVSGYGVADGKEKWSLRLPTDICAAPTAPTAEGKIVIGILESTAEAAECSVLQMIDLRTGKQGWKKTVPKVHKVDIQLDVAMSVNGGTVTYGRAAGTNAYRVDDGKEVFAQQPGNCQPVAFTSGPRVIASASCPFTADGQPNMQIQEVDPATGRAKWTAKVSTGWTVDKVFSVSPLVLSLRKVGEFRVVALNDDGTLRSRIDSGAEQFSMDGAMDDSNKNLDGCGGVAADADTFYRSTGAGSKGSGLANKVIAFDLDTGKPKWKADSPPGQVMEPMRMEGGKVLVHVEAWKKAGAIATLSADGSDLETVLRHPLASAGTERSMMSPKAAYVDGRTVLTNPLVVSDDDVDEAKIKTVMVFGE